MANRTRLVGARIDGDQLDREMAARGLEGADLAKLAELTTDTIARARQSKRISRASLLKIAVGLDRVPIIPMAAALVGVPSTASMKRAGAHSTAPAQEVSGGTRATSRT